MRNPLDNDKMIVGNIEGIPRGVYTERSECARNDNSRESVPPPQTHLTPPRNCDKLKGRIFFNGIKIKWN